MTTFGILDELSEVSNRSGSGSSLTISSLLTFASTLSSMLRLFEGDDLNLSLAKVEAVIWSRMLLPIERTFSELDLVGFGKATTVCLLSELG